MSLQMQQHNLLMETSDLYDGVEELDEKYGEFDDGIGEWEVAHMILQMALVIDRWCK